MTRVLYPGSFDPITKGHMDIIDKALGLFSEVVIAIMQNPNKKNSFFKEEERLEIIKELYKENKNIKVIIGNSATVDVAVNNNCQGIIRGVRSFADFDYEILMQQINKEISNNKINTICLFADKEYQYISSSVVKEVFSLGKDISKYVDSYVQQKMFEKGEINER